MENLNIVLLVVTLILLVLNLLILALCFKKLKGIGGDTSIKGIKELEKAEIENTALLKNKVESLENNLLLGLDAKLALASKEELDIETRRLNEFQNGIIHNLNNQVNAMNESMNKRLSEINIKNSEQSKNIEATLKGLIDQDNKRLLDFQNAMTISINAQIKAINDKMDASIKSINERVNQSLSDGFKGTSDSMLNLQKSLATMQEAQKNIDELQSDITSLKDVLSNNQQKGRYGEWQLEMILESLFNGCKGTLYDTQYVLKEAKNENDTQLKPDAVVFLDGEKHHQIICIDSKFSLVGYEDLFDSKKHLNDQEIALAKNSFSSALKKRIDETAKYIVPGLTISNSLMFVPNDGVFAYIHNDFPEVIEYAQRKKVIVVSPTILQPLLASFRVVQTDAKTNENLAKIKEQLDYLGGQFKLFGERWNALNKNIKSLTGNSEKFDITVGKINKKFNQVKNIEFPKDNNPENGNDEANLIEIDKDF